MEEFYTLGKYTTDGRDKLDFYNAIIKSLVKPLAISKHLK